ncbi:hypothetical protein BMI86_13850 [Thioclava sp. DLFJ5-1]|nr:site-specific integrase [Thioclava sp. DLFJ5-1]OOY19706.1 hypothetical protein BMI86_13850 [Thioclava sp. DLFJ5-1]
MAVQMARQLSSRLDLFFAEAMSDSTLDREKLNELARATFTEFLKEFDWLNRRAYSDEGAARNSRRVEGAREQLRMKWWQNAGPTADEVLAENAITAPFNSPEYREFCFKLLRAGAEASRISAARYDGDFTAVPADPLFLGCDIDPPAPTLSLEEAFKKYEKEKVKGGHWRADAQRENHNTFALLNEHFGEVPLASITRKQVAEFLDLVRRLPKKRGKSSALRRLTLPELVESVDAGDLEPLSSTTVAKHMKNVVALFHWAVRQGEIRENPAAGVHQSSKRTIGTNEERRSWSTEQIRMLFSAPIYRGCRGRQRRFSPGTEIIKDSWYWLPLFMAFHPLRPEEIAQLHLSDVSEVDGSTVIDINGGVTAEGAASTGKQLKNAASRRQVPVHSILSDLGFSAYVQKLQSAGQTRLFPDLSAQGKAGRYSQYICKRLNEKLPHLGIEGVSVYGLRHSAITALANACDNATMRKRLAGHTLTGEDGRYIKGFEISRLKEAIEGIQYPGINADFITGAQSFSSR